MLLPCNLRVICARAVAPAHLRGTLGSAFLLTAVTGMLFGQVAGLPLLLGTPDGWPPHSGRRGRAGGQRSSSSSSRSLSSHRAGCSSTAAPNLPAPPFARLRGCDVDDFELVEELHAMGDIGLVDDSTAGGTPARGVRPGPTGADDGGRGRRDRSGDRSGAPELRISSVRARKRAAAASRLGSARRGVEPQHPLNSSSGSALQLLLEPSLRRPLVVCVVLMAAQQFSGINNAFNYSSPSSSRAG